MSPDAHSFQLMTRTRAALRERHHGPRVQQAYVEWIRRYLVFHAGRRAEGLGAREIAAFVTDLAMVHHLDAVRCHQARSAVLFLYRQVLRMDLPRPVHLHVPVPGAAARQAAQEPPK